MKDIKVHEWFKGVDFEQILQRKVKPSFIPSVNGDGDTKYFEKHSDFALREASLCEYEDEFKELKIRMNWNFLFIETDPFYNYIRNLIFYKLFSLKHQKCTSFCEKHYSLFLQYFEENFDGI